MDNKFESIINESRTYVLKEEKEDKQKFLNDLCTLLQNTRHYSGLESIEYVKSESGEYAILSFENGAEKKADITADSEISMITDIINQTE